MRRKVKTIPLHIPELRITVQVDPDESVVAVRRKYLSQRQQQKQKIARARCTGIATTYETYYSI